MLWDLAHPFTMGVAPQPGDIDGLNHTNNAVYVQWCEKIAWSHSEAASAWPTTGVWTPRWRSDTASTTKRGKLVRFLQVEKMRASEQSMERHAVEVGKNGIQVLGPLLSAP